MSTVGQGGTDAAVLLASLAGKHVCPFCGTVRRQRAEPCPRCTMEDTTETRQATRNRIGPWYVLQSRNPSAPGMKFDTLLLLIRRGQVTPRSIVRGPTTHQLWRFAVRVRGLSREWGMCYSCGREIEATENACRHCHKLQEPPLDPDALLEVRQVKPPQPQPQPLPLPPPHKTPTQIVLPELGGTLIPTTSPAPAPASPAPKPIPMPLPAADHPPSPLIKPSPTDRAVEPMLSPKDLAAAFSLDFNAASQSPDFPPRRRGRLVTRIILLLLLLGIIGFVAAVAFNPRLRRQTLEPASRYVDQWMDRWRSATPAQHTLPAPTPIPPAERLAAPVNIAPPPPAGPAPALTPLAPPPARTPLSLKNLPLPQAAHPDESTSAAVDAAPPPQKPKVTPPPPPKTLAPPAPSGDSAEQVRQLWIQAISAEGSGDLAGAVKIYEKIQTYPKDLWPTSLQLRLEQVKKQMAH